jgi:hypothetical protein
MGKKVKETDELLMDPSSAQIQFRVRLASMVHDNTMQNSMAAIDACTESLRQGGNSVSSAFKLFHTTYLYHASTKVKRAKAYPQQNIHPSSAIDDVVSAFHRKPFSGRAIGEGAIPINILLALNANRDVADMYTRVMTEVGQDWIEDQLLKDKTVNGIELVQSRLMELLWSCSLEELKTESLGLSMSRDEIDELEDYLKGAIADTKAQKISVAFCGMVKAGLAESLPPLFIVIVT